MDNQRDYTHKISFLGDITLDRPMLKASLQKGGGYDFSGMLEGLGALLSESDCVIGNLETVFAGEEKGYNPGILSYNSPDSLLREIKKLGDPLVLGLANNHCLDMGIPGLKRTMSLLDQHHILYTGAGEAMGERFLTLCLKGLRLAVFSCASMMNTKENGFPHSIEELQFVNSFFSPREAGIVTWKRRLLCSQPGRWARQKVLDRRQGRGQGIIKPYSDNQPISPAAQEQISGILTELNQAKKNHDLVMICLHSGGQFNEEPGSYTEALMEQLAGHADIVAGHHPHVVQRAVWEGETFCAYSMGSLNMSPSADYVAPGSLSAYSMALHVYISQKEERTYIKKISCSFLKAVEDESAFVRVVPVADLHQASSLSRRAGLENDMEQILTRCGIERREGELIQKEYEISSKGQPPVL